MSRRSEFDTVMVKGHFGDLDVEGRVLGLNFNSYIYIYIYMHIKM
jgi:hypothetical protein